MKTALRSYIFFFLLLILASMSLSFVALFRFSAGEYIDAIARQQVNQNLRAAEKLLDKTEDNNKKIILPDNILLYDHELNLIHPKKPGNKIKELAENLYDNYFIKQNAGDGKHFVVSTETRDYLVDVVSLDSTNRYQAAYLVSYTNLYNDAVLLAQVETLVLLITLILALIFVPILWIFSGRLVEPLRQLQQYARQLGKGDFQVTRIPSSIREIEELSGTFAEMARELEDSISAQKTFFQNASHELRTPLMSIQGYAQGLQDGIFSDPSLPADIIIAESERMKLLIDGILTLARLDANEQELLPVQINLNDFLSQLILRFEGVSRNMDRAIILNIPDPDLSICLDTFLLEKATSNLLSNALRYAEKNIFVTVTAEADKFDIAFENDGPPLTEDDLSSIFRRFHKGDKGEFGIGLSIVSSSMKYLGGEFSAGNGEYGARFLLTLHR